MSPKRKEKSKTPPGSPSLEDSPPQFLGKKREPNITTKETKEKGKSYENNIEEFHSNDSNDLLLKENSKNKAPSFEIDSKDVFNKINPEEIVARVKKDLPKIPSLTSLTEYFNSTYIKLETQKQELSEIATVTLKEKSKINITPKILYQNQNHMNLIFRSLKTSFDTLNILQEDNNIVVTITQHQERLLKIIRYNAEMRKIKTILKEEAGKLRSKVYKEKSTSIDSISKKNRIIKNINKDFSTLEEEIKKAFVEVNNSNDINIEFFNYKVDQFNDDFSYHKILHSKLDDKEEKELNEGIKKGYLYSQNREIPFLEIEECINFNSHSDGKKKLISLNNNNGVGKSHLLDMLKYRNSLSETFFLPRIELKKIKPAPEALLELILDSIHFGFGLDKIATLKDDTTSNKERIIKDICNLLQKIMIEKNDIDEVKETCITLFNSYFKMRNDKEVFDPKLIYEKLEHKRAIYFCFDEIGKVQKSKVTELGIDSFRYHFKDLPKTHDRLIAMDEFRELLNHIVMKPSLGAIVAGKNGIEKFMGSNSGSPNQIKHINLPPLLKEYIEPILKFELYRNTKSKFREFLKNAYPYECTEEKKNELNEKMNSLIDKLDEYTAGHPRLLKYTLDNFMKLDKKKIKSEKLGDINDDFMYYHQIEGEDLKDIFSRYNNEILYQFFLKKLSPLIGSRDMEILKGKELLYIFYKLNTRENSNINVEKVKQIFSYSSLDLTIEDLFNSIGVSYLEDTKETTFKVMIPKYIADKLDEIEKQSYSSEFVQILMFFMYKIAGEKCSECVSIFSYALNIFEITDDKRILTTQLIDGYSKGEKYLNNIFKQIEHLDKEQIVMFNLENNYALDGLLLRYSRKKLIIHLIQVKTGEFDRAKIYNQIMNLDQSIESLKSLLKNKKVPATEIEISYILISKIQFDKEDYRTSRLAEDQKELIDVELKLKDKKNNSIDEINKLKKDKIKLENSIEFWKKESIMGYKYIKYIEEEDIPIQAITMTSKALKIIQDNKSRKTNKESKKNVKDSK